jgi:hypothetical protein
MKDNQIFNSLKGLRVKALNKYGGEKTKTFQKERARSWNFFVKTLPQEKLQAL